jgi:hypothetical protein
MLGAVIIIVALVAAAALAAIFLMGQKKQDDPAILARFRELPQFTISAKHVLAGTGIAVDEDHFKLAVVTPADKHAAVLMPRDIKRWVVRTTDDGKVAHLQIMSRRHEKPLSITFPNEAAAEEWAGTLKRVSEEH